MRPPQAQYGHAGAPRGAGGWRQRGQVTPLMKTGGRRKGDDHRITTGKASSLIAWDHVCDTKDSGGLGLKDLGLQNICLLLKLIHKLHSEHVSSWARWVRSNACIASLIGDLHGQHWEMLLSLLPVYRAATTVILGDGTTTSFWHDAWVGDDSMADRFPELYSHCRLQELTVKQASEGALQSSLVQRRSPAALLQLSQALQILEQQRLGDSKDRRQSTLLKRNGDLDTSMLCFTRH